MILQTLMLLNFLEATKNDLYLNIVKIEPIEIETIEEKSVMNTATIQWCITSWFQLRCMTLQLLRKTGDSCLIMTQTNG